MKDERIDYSRKRSVYLDYAASTPADPKVLGAWDRACRGVYGNPASLNVCGLDAGNILEESRNRIAGYFSPTRGRSSSAGAGPKV